MRETITIQVGQCGNQIGNEFWERIYNEHGILLNGDLKDISQDLEDRKDAFFYQADDGKYIPRAILVDLEPRVVDSVLSSGRLFNQENIFISNEGGGAGNNWAHGYHTASTVKEEVMEIIHREAEGSDNLESFFLIHSIAGGTGSGFGSLLLEEIREEYPKKIIQGYSIFPNNLEVSDVVVQPYNSILTLQRLSQCCDSIIVMDNEALGRIALDSLRIKTPNFQHINSLISTVICASTSTIRFPSYMFCDQRSINSTIVPFDRLKFVVPSYTPFISDENLSIVRKTTCSEVLRKLLLPKTRLATYESSKTHSVISMLNILNGVINPLDVQKSLVRIQDKGMIQFAPWISPSYHVALSRKFTAPPSSNRISGLCLSNSSGIASLLSKICDQFDKLKNKNAFTEIYRKFTDDLNDFDVSRECVQNVIDEYLKSELSTYQPY
ncbi:Tubulin gamma chain [Astathelohania contejeani]|uniref:Tubulin gamma chain n=1 Tax=Astathelohania contejeani TaxID=164912 RepID=A0ABQ7HYL1_9MICR|nr:Tubulin gamma chain [Thelohania contejeani]